MGSPIEEGKEAARMHVAFSDCPYNYGNCGVTNMDEYAATGNNLKRDLWFKGWREEQAAMGLDSRFIPLKTPNDEGNARREQT